MVPFFSKHFENQYTTQTLTFNSALCFMHICIQEWKYYAFTYLWMYEYLHAQILLPLRKLSQWWEMRVSLPTPTVQSLCVHRGHVDHLFLKRKIKGALKFSGLTIIKRLPKDYHSKFYPPFSSSLLQKNYTCKFTWKFFFSVSSESNWDIGKVGKSYPDKL